MEAAVILPVTELLATLARMGAPLSASPGGRITAPAGSSVRPDVAPLLAEVRARKPEVLAELARVDEPEPGGCVCCSTHTAGLFCSSCWASRLARRRGGRTS